MLSENILLEKITKHVDYAQMRGGHIISTSGFILQGRARNSDSLVNPNVARYGLTCSKRIGNAVKRNRAKRRLRSLVANILPSSGPVSYTHLTLPTKA